MQLVYIATEKFSLMQVNVEIIRDSKEWKEFDKINLSLCKKILKETLDRVGLFDKTNSVEMSILLTNDEKMHELNKKFMNKDKPTNILSFPDRSLDYRLITSDDFEGDLILGDVAISYNLLKKESKNFKILAENHFTHLLVHAILHLIGYDHEINEDQEKMIDLELTILKKFRINIPPLYAQEK